MVAMYRGVMVGLEVKVGLGPKVGVGDRVGTAVGRGVEVDGRVGVKGRIVAVADVRRMAVSETGSGEDVWGWVLSSEGDIITADGFSVGKDVTSCGVSNIGEV